MSHPYGIGSPPPQLRGSMFQNERHPWNGNSPPHQPFLPVSPQRPLSYAVYAPALHGGGAPPAREGAMDFALCPSLRNGRRVWWRCPPAPAPEPEQSPRTKQPGTRKEHTS